MLNLDDVEMPSGSSEEIRASAAALREYAALKWNDIFGELKNDR